MEANLNDNEMLRTVALVKLEAATSVLATIQRAQLEFNVQLAIKRGEIDEKVANHILDDMDQHIKRYGKSVDDALMIFKSKQVDDEFPTAAELLDRAMKEQQ